jgi:hypothetical protein
VRPSDVVLDSPRFDRAPRIREMHEPALVETLVPKSPVEALDITVLNRFARLDELHRDPARVRPLIEVLTRELRAVVAPERRGKTGSSSRK